MARFEESVDLSPEVARDEQFLAAYESAVLSSTEGWNQRQVSVTVAVENRSDEAATIDEAFNGADASPATYTDLKHVAVDVAAPLKEQRRFFLWISFSEWKPEGRAGFTVSSPSEVEARGLASMVASLGERHAARITAQQQAAAEEAAARAAAEEAAALAVAQEPAPRAAETAQIPASQPVAAVARDASGPTPRTQPFWRDHWVVTIVGGAIAALAGGLALAALTRALG